MKTFVVNSQSVPEIYIIPDKVVMVKSYHRNTEELVSICYKDVVTKKHVAFVDFIQKVFFIADTQYHQELFFKLTDEYPNFVYISCDELKCKKDMQLVRYRCLRG